VPIRKVRIFSPSLSRKNKVTLMRIMATMISPAVRAPVSAWVPKELDVKNFWTESRVAVICASSTWKGPLFRKLCSWSTPEMALTVSCFHWLRTRNTMPVMTPPKTPRIARNDTATARARGRPRAASQRTRGAIAEARITAMTAGITTSGTRVRVHRTAQPRAATVRTWTERMLARPRLSDQIGGRPVRVSDMMMFLFQ
jgi:hypothetical protein